MSEKFETSDLAIAAYLMLYHFKLLECGRLPSGKFRFVFADPDKNAQQKSVEFLSSECSRFDAHLKNLKKMLYKN